KHDEWAEGRRYLGLDVLARCRITAHCDTTDGVKTTEPWTAGQLELELGGKRLTVRGLGDKLLVTLSRM
ncbi:MAG: hypothetical protein Q4C67_04690, partial [Deinococcus sp.]|nr:hypothetical protein [Deinococcus sp.]